MNSSVISVEADENIGNVLEIMKKEDPSTFYLPIPDGISTIENYINNMILPPFYITAIFN